MEFLRRTGYGSNSIRSVKSRVRRQVDALSTMCVQNSIVVGIAPKGGINMRSPGGAGASVGPTILRPIAVIFAGAQRQNCRLELGTTKDNAVRAGVDIHRLTTQERHKGEAGLGGELDGQRRGRGYRSQDRNAGHHSE
jgi:hypothetical protein